MLNPFICVLYNIKYRGNFMRLACPRSNLQKLPIFGCRSHPDPYTRCVFHPEGKDEDGSAQPWGIPVTTATPAQAGGPGSVSRTSTPRLSSTGMQPPLSALPVQLNPGGSGGYSFVAPEAAHLPGVPGSCDPSQMPGSAALYPSDHGWATPGHFPGTFYGSLASSQYRAFPSTSTRAMGQLYAPSHLQPLASLQLVQTQPTQPGHVHQPPFPGGAGIFLYTHATLAPIPLAERVPAVPASRAVPTTSEPSGKVVLVLQEVAPRATGAAAPAGGCYSAVSQARNRNVAKGGSKGPSRQQWGIRPSPAERGPQPPRSRAPMPLHLLPDVTLRGEAEPASPAASLAVAEGAERSDAGPPGTGPGKEPASQAHPHFQGAPAPPSTAEDTRSRQQLPEVLRTPPAPVLPLECAAGPYPGNVQASNTGPQESSILRRESEPQGDDLQGGFPQPQLGESPTRSGQALDTFAMSVAPAVSTEPSTEPACPTNAETSSAGLQDKETDPDTGQMAGALALQEPRGPEPFNPTLAESVVLSGADTQPRGESDQQPPLPGPESEESLLGDLAEGLPPLEDIFAECPEIEQLIASIEPLLPDWLFPPLEALGPEDILLESCPLGEAVGTEESQGVSGPSQDLQGLASEPQLPDSTTTNEPPICLPAKEEIPIIDLCSSDSDEPEAPGSHVSGPPGSFQGPAEPATNPVEPPAIKSAALLGKQPRVVLVPIFQQQKKIDELLAGASYRVGKKSSAAPDSKEKKKHKEPTSETSRSRSPGGKKPSHDTKAPGTGGKRKCTDPGSRHTSKIPRLSPEPGPSKTDHASNLPAQPSSKIPPPPLIKRKRKKTSAEGEPSQKIPRTNPEVPVCKPPKHQGTGSLVRAVKRQGQLTPEQKKTSENVPARDKGGKTLPQKKEGPEESGHAQRPQVTGVGAPRRSDSKELAKPSTPAKAPPQGSARKGKMKLFVPAPEPPVREQSKPAGSQGGLRLIPLPIGERSTKPAKKPPKTLARDKAKVRADPGVTGKKKEPSVEPRVVLKPPPKSDLAQHMMDSVHVLYPLGKKNVPPVPLKKAPQAPDNTAACLAAPARSLPKPPQGLASCSKPGPSSGPQQPPPLPSTLPRRMQTLTAAAGRPHGPKPWASSQPPPASGGRTQPHAAGKAPGLPPRPAGGEEPPWRPSHRGRPSQPPRPASPPYEGAMFIPWRTPPPDLEVSEPISEEQRPVREMLRQQAQREREEASQWTAVGRVKFFVEREKEMATSLKYGYPKRH